MAYMHLGDELLTGLAPIAKDHTKGLLPLFVEAQVATLGAPQGSSILSHLQWWWVKMYQLTGVHGPLSSCRLSCLLFHCTSFLLATTLSSCIHLGRIRWKVCFTRPAPRPGIRLQRTAHRLFHGMTCHV